ncbi:hypothetical protein L1987_55638 [Smallanthus sonchifolius]|uniref:Uncharacterized protein n=1 Tax=Smallanthus sonchifolius TaxID=185202 RepID=A0ACB9EAW5_9ASTR|nr:hypothetical protein L1987_55638 [Smallanthus sonchifolius]
MVYYYIISPHQVIHGIGYDEIGMRKQTMLELIGTKRLGSNGVVWMATVQFDNWRNPRGRGPLSVIHIINPRENMNRWRRAAWSSTSAYSDPMFAYVECHVDIKADLAYLKGYVWFGALHLGI